MAAYNRYAYRGKPQEDEWNNANYCDDRTCRTVVVEPDGRKKTVIGCSPYHDTVDSFVVQSEKTEYVYSPHVPEFRHSSPKKKVEYGHEKWRRPSSPDHPPEIDDFFNGIQIEASRPHRPNANPSVGATNWRPNPNPNPHSNGYGGYNNKRSTGNYPIRNDKYDDYYREDSPTRTWDRPVNHATRPVRISSPGRDAKLGVATNRIEEAIDYLKGANTKISPATVNGINGGNHTQYGRPYVSPRPYEVEEVPPRRYEQNPHQYPASSPPWSRTASPPPRTYGHGRGGVIDSDEAAKRFGGKIVRI